MADATGAFAAANAVVANVEQIVQQRIDASNETASQLQNTAMSSIAALGAINFEFGDGALPEAPNIDPNITVSFNLPGITPQSFGTITSQVPDPPSLIAVPDIAALVIPDFQSSIGSLNIPVAPAYVEPAAPPDQPDIPDVTLPASPSIVLPALPTLSEINIPDFEGLTLPAFDATAPEFEGSALPGILQWSEPIYHTEILDEVFTVLRRLWDGGSGIPPAVELAMWERAQDREDLSAARDINAVAEEFSLRGFTTPTGMQAARADQLRETLALKKLGLNRDLTIQIAQWQIDNIKFACTQAVAAETVLVNIFLNSAARMFEAAKFQIEAQINIYQAQVALFNAKMNGFQISATVFKTLVEADTTKIEVFKAQIQAEVARGQINEQRVNVYKVQVEAVGTQIEIYKAQMQGAEIQSNVIRNRIEAFKAQIDAYTAQIGSQKIKFDAYDSQVKGEASKAGIIDSEARAYSALISGRSSQADIGVKTAEVAISRNQQLVQSYTAGLEAEKVRIQSQLSVIQTGAAAYVADTQRFAAQAQAEGTKAQLQVSAKESELRTNVAFYQAQVQAFLGNMESMIRKASLVVDALKAAGQISSTLAAGAMAGVHVGAQLSGGGQASASGSYAESFDITKGVETFATNKNYRYEGGNA